MEEIRFAEYGIQSRDMETEKLLYIPKKYTLEECAEFIDGLRKHILMVLPVDEMDLVVTLKSFGDIGLTLNVTYNPESTAYHLVTFDGDCEEDENMPGMYCLKCPFMDKEADVGQNRQYRELIFSVFRVLYGR